MSKVLLTIPHKRTQSLFCQTYRKIRQYYKNTLFQERNLININTNLELERITTQNHGENTQHEDNNEKSHKNIKRFDQQPAKKIQR